MFSLDIFPEGSLAESVITTVWIGVLVVAFFSMRLGWPFSGLVVPGYLVPIMIAKPLAAIVVCCEGFLTYAIVKLVSDRLAHRSRAWSAFFGRDRFLALVICSLLVRITLDGWLLPVLGEFINRSFSVEFDYRNNLCSFGLIIVALIANQFWKTGLIRGLVPFCVTIGCTYVVVRYGLIAWTNFNIGSLEFMYENISSSLMASPKAYVILITTAFLASRINLIYGWDFNGILIPSLLALQWYQPAKILTSFFEAGIILGVACLVLRAPGFRGRTIEGARKLVLFFNISFAFKLVVAYSCNAFYVETPVTDFYGFGYLLSTLIALKMHHLHSVARFVRSTTQMSLIGAVAANVVGFLLTFSPALWSWNLPEVRAEGVREERAVDGSLVEQLRSDKVHMYLRRSGSKFSLPLPQEIDVFVEGIGHLRRYAESRSRVELRAGEKELERIGFGVWPIDGRYLYIAELHEGRGWGVFVLHLRPQSDIVVEIPAPLDEWAVLESGAHLFEVFEARALAVAGSGRRAAGDAASDVLANGRTMYHVFHREMATEGVLQVRGYAERSLNALLIADDSAATDGERSSGLWVTGEFPKGIGYRKLQEILGPYRVEWGATPHHNLQRDESLAGFCELVLSREERKKLLAAAVVGGAGAGGKEHSSVGVESLREFVRRAKEHVPRAGSNVYRQPQEEELLFLDAEVIGPILGLVGWTRDVAGDDEARPAPSAERWQRALRVIETAARPVGYQVKYCSGPRDEGYIVLAEMEEATPRRGWGTYVFRAHGGGPFIVQVPRPILERNSIEFGLQLLEELNAKALMVAGAHPWTNFDGSADMIRNDNRVNLFNCVNQVLAREAGTEPRLVVQARAFGYRNGTEPVPGDALLAFGDGRTRRGDLGVLGSEVLDVLQRRGLTVRLVDGRLHGAGYEAHSAPQARYLHYAPNKEFCAVWLSPFVRADLGAASNSALQSILFERVGIRTLETSLAAIIATTQDKAEEVGVGGFPLDAVAAFLRTRDVLALDALREECRGDLELTRVVDNATADAYGVISAGRGASMLVFKLAGSFAGDVVEAARWEEPRSVVERFRRARTPFLWIGD